MNKKIPWYQRYSIGFELRFTGIEGSKTPKEWLFSYSAKYDKIKSGRKIHWPHAWVCLFGFQIGAGLYLDFNPYG